MNERTFHCLNAEHNHVNHDDEKFCSARFQLGNADKKISYLTRRLEIAEEALSKYADIENWGYRDDSGCPKGQGEVEEVCFLETRVAKEALAKIWEGK